MGRFYKKGGKTKPISAKRQSSMHDSENENDARKKTLRQLNYRSGDYVGPNPSHRSIVLDRARRSKQPWEQRRRG